MKTILNCLLSLVLIAAALGQAQPSAAANVNVPRKVKDINTCTESAIPLLLAQTGDTVFFLARETGGGQSFWRSDGTAEGTRVIKRMDPAIGPRSASVWLNGRFYFIAQVTEQNLSTPDYYLWTSDGTPDNTHEVSGFATDFSSRPYISELVALNGVLYVLFSDWGYSTYSTPGTFELWRSDGTSAGTQRVTKGAVSYIYTSPELVSYRGFLYFTAYDAEHGSALWRSDGTALGTQFFFEPDTADTAGPSDLYVGGSYLYFTAHHPSGRWLIWTSDGTREGTLPVLAENYDLASGVEAVINNIAYFYSNQSGEARLFRTDGTAEGTWMVKDVPVLFSKFDYLAQAGDRLYFVANSTQLWRSDGTNAGTVMLKDIATRPFQQLGVSRALEAGGSAYLSIVDDGGGPAVLWRTDGTPDGTQMVVAPDSRWTDTPLSVYSGPVLLENGRVLVSGYGPGSCAGSELRRIDPPAAGDPPLAVVVRDIGWRTLDSTTLEGAAAYQGKVYFAANDGHTGTQLWASDGTESGTHLVKGIYGFKDGLGGIIFGLEAAGAGGWLYFTATDDLGKQLWRTDGTEANTIRLTDVQADPSMYTRPQGLVAFHDRMYFYNHNAEGILGLWSSDGTPEGTGEVTPIPAAGAEVVGKPVEMGGALYLLVTAVMGQGVLYRSDGTAGGLELVKYWPDLQTPWVRELVRAGDRLYFTAQDAEHGQEVWVTDGTPEGTRLFADLTPGPASSGVRFIEPLGSNVIVATEGPDVWTVWRVDGASAEVTPLLYVGKVPGYKAITGVQGSGGKVYFTVNLPGDRVLWATDGTQAGTLAVMGGVGQFYSALGLVFFSSGYGNGTELWSSDGTPKGTRLIDDIWPGPDSSNPVGFLYADGRLWFSAEDLEHGREPWVYDVLPLRNFLPVAGR